MKDIIIVDCCDIGMIRGLIGAWQDMDTVRVLSDTMAWFDDIGSWAAPTVNERANGKCKNPKKGRW
jgi:hypothetical protein